MAKKLGNLFTAPMVARLCECDLKTVHNWAHANEIKFFRTPGGHLRFRKSDVVSFMKKYGYPIPKGLV